MDFLDSQQVSAKSLESVDFELFVAVSGNEYRCTYLAEKLSLAARHKVVLASTEKSKDSIRKKNDKYFRTESFNCLEISGNQNDKLKLFLKDHFTVTEKKSLNLLIDYSCMTKTWYASISNVLQEMESKVNEIKVYFAYTPVKYEEAIKSRSIKKIESGFSPGNLSPSKPTALIIGLGIEKSTVEHIIKYLQPDLTILMYSDPAIDDRYTQAIFHTNQDLIHKMDARNLINYPLTDANAINEILTSKCVELRLFYNIVIAPLGPKVFALNAYLLSNRYPDIFVWDIGPELQDKGVKYLPSGELVVQKVTFVNEEEDF